MKILLTKTGKLEDMEEKHSWLYKMKKLYMENIPETMFIDPQVWQGYL